jgi:HSP20 family protein
MKKELVLWNNPFGLLHRFTGDMERFFDEFATGRLFPADARLSGAGRWMPNVDAFEKDGSLVVRADLPGVTKDAVNVEVAEGLLSIKGERHKEFEEEKAGVYRHERAHGSFYRAFPLPDGVKAESVKATFNNGVLEVTVPLPAAKKDAKAHHVEVHDGSGEMGKEAKVKSAA